jgi:hypothetical protein
MIMIMICYTLLTLKDLLGAKVNLIIYLDAHRGGERGRRGAFMYPLNKRL